jgi:hypothetical protein
LPGYKNISGFLDFFLPLQSPMLCKTSFLSSFLRPPSIIRHETC